MKLILIITIAFLSGCGLQDQIDSLKRRSSTNETDIADIKSRLAALELQVLSTRSDLNAQGVLLASNQAAIDSLTLSLSNVADSSSAQYAAIVSQLTSMLNVQTNVQADVLVLQNQYALTLMQLATLQGYKSIVSLKDPCGAQGSYNEIFLQLSDGTYIASFSDNASGTNTRFTVLTDGNFVTTDGTHCHFSVSGNGTIIINEHN